MQLCFEPIEAWLNFSGFVGDDVVKPKLTLEIWLSWVRNLAAENVESHWKKGNLLAQELVPVQFANGCSIWGDSCSSIFLALPSWIPFSKGLILPTTALVTNCLFEVGLAPEQTVCSPWQPWAGRGWAGSTGCCSSQCGEAAAGWFVFTSCSQSVWVKRSGVFPY